MNTCNEITITHKIMCLQNTYMYLGVCSIELEMYFSGDKELWCIGSKGLEGFHWAQCCSLWSSFCLLPASMQMMIVSSLVPG